MEVQERYQAALDSLVAKLKQDHYVLAAVLYGSVARGDAWEKSDIDLTIIQRDGLQRGSRCFWLVEDGINRNYASIEECNHKASLHQILGSAY